MSEVPPTRLNRRSSRKWSSLTWTVGLVSAISSRKRVPPIGDLEQPFLRRRASVKAPASWPKSSLSSSVSGSAAQQMVSKRCGARALARWSSFAASPLPVPLSPTSRTVEALLAAMRSRRPRVVRMAEESPTIRSNGRCTSLRLTRRIGLTRCFERASEVKKMKHGARLRFHPSRGRQGDLGTYIMRSRHSGVTKFT